jgi:putative flippase GtrA
MTPTFYRKGLALYQRHRCIIDYLFWGVMTTLVNYVAYFACRLCFGIDYITSNVIAWAAGVAFGFVVNKVYVFRSLDWSAKVTFRECWQFVAARLFSGVLETAILKIFVDWLGMDDAIVKIFSNIVVVIVNYVLSKLVIFRKKKVLLAKLDRRTCPAQPREWTSRKQRGGRTSEKNKLARGKAKPECKAKVRRKKSRRKGRR